MNVKLAIAALDNLLKLPTANKEAKYYARLALSYLRDGEETSDKRKENAGSYDRPR